MKRQFIQAGLVAGTIWVAAVPAMSQELEEVTVTANRREESAQSVPISITAISAESLEAARVEGVRDLAFTTPGLQIANRSAAFVPYIRGIGSLDVSGGQETAVAVYVDGVYLSSVWGAHMSFNSIDRVEVLKGPQGTLFGRNATGGLIHVITKDPGQESVIRGSASYGNFNAIDAKIYAGGGISERVSADISAYYADQDESYTDNAFTGGATLEGQRDYGARTKWIFQASDATKLTFSADFANRRSGLGDNRALLEGSVSNFGPLGVFTSPANRGDSQINHPVFHEVKSWGAMAKVEHSFANFDFVSISAYRGIDGLGSFDNDGTPAPLVNVSNRFEVRTLTQEFQLLSNSDSSFRWIVGGFYMDDSHGYIRPGGLLLSGAAFFGLLGAFDPALAGAPGAFGPAHQIETQSAALFAEGTYSFSDATRLTVGLRYTQDKKQLVGGTEFFTGLGALTGVNPTLYTFVPTPTAEDTFKKPTWRLVVEHDVNDDSLLYGSYNRGYRSGSYNTVSVDRLSVKPEIVDSIELGWKNQLLDNRLRLNAAVFYTDYQDLQIAVSNATGQRLLNVASATIKGLELEGEARVSEGLSLTFGLEYLNTEFTDFDPSVVPPCTARNSAGTTVADPGCNVVGNQLMRAPEFQMNAGFRYSHAISNGLIGVDGNIAWTDKFPWEIDNRLWEDSYTVANASVYWAAPDDRYTVRVFAKNLFDEEYDSFVVGQAGLNDQYALAPPRTYGIEFGFKF